MSDLKDCITSAMADGHIQRYDELGSGEVGRSVLGGVRDDDYSRMISASSSSVRRLEEQALGVIDQVTAYCVELVVLFTNGTKQIGPPTILAVLFEPIRFGRTDRAFE